MTAPVKEKTDVAKRVDANVADLRARNAMVAQIRGTQWGLGIDSRAARAVSNYCLEMGLDPVRHVELLGGRIYLTSEFYEERAAPFIRNGELVPHEPEFINVDPRLDALVSGDDAELATWARTEKLRRTKARIEHNAPEAAVSTCVRRCTIAVTGKTLVGVNWCGGGTRKKYAHGGVLKDADPIGDLEPTKTSITRAGRRMWKQVADVIVDYGKAIKHIEARAEIINEGLDTLEPLPGDIVVPEPQRISPAPSEYETPGEVHPALRSFVGALEREPGEEPKLEPLSSDARPEPQKASRRVAGPPVSPKDG